MNSSYTIVTLFICLLKDRFNNDYAKISELLSLVSYLIMNDQSPTDPLDSFLCWDQDHIPCWRIETMAKFLGK